MTGGNSTSVDKKKKRIPGLITAKGNESFEVLSTCVRSILFLNQVT